MSFDFNIKKTPNNPYANPYQRKERDYAKYDQGVALGRIHPQGLQSPGLIPDSEGARLLKGCLEDIDCSEGLQEGARESALERSLRQPN